MQKNRTETMTAVEKLWKKAEHWETMRSWKMQQCKNLILFRQIAEALKNYSTKTKVFQIKL